ncbi:hypothetical protein EV421DRAFT_1946178 [Armillaria borealis]|uniref:Uncharacterized protein n=1 Tax=Armillaria borealis TaxID=47425 RepID=A0AA39JJJ4_9AGAR|nr:hypothetical protein EV421DRAFT_1946178 [Armillaria borealis]
MQQTADISTHTLITLVAIAIGLATTVTIFLLCRTYWQEIRQYIRRLFLVTPRQPAPRPPTVPLHYVRRTHGGPIGPPLPPLFPSQSSGLSTPSYPSDSSCIHTEQEELDIGEEGRRILNADHQSLSILTGSIERHEKSEEVSTPKPLESTRSSPEFPTHHSTPRPVLILTDSETTTGDEPRLPWQWQHQLRNEIGKLTWLHGNQGDRVCEWVRGTSVQ